MKNSLTLDEQQKEFLRCCLDPNVLTVFCDAAAGSGKSTIAMDAGYILVRDERNDYDGIVYIVSPYGEGKQGYLPGSITGKSKVYFEPAYQAMIECGMNPNRDICDDSMAGKKRGDGFVKLITHTYLRGTNLQSKVVIIDEAQNYTVPELKKVLTRIHDSCKVIVIGHGGQIDIAGQSGFRMYLEHFRSREWCRVCTLEHNYRGQISRWADSIVG